MNLAQKEAKQTELFITPSIFVTSRWDLGWCSLHPNHYNMLCLIIILSSHLFGQAQPAICKRRRCSLPCSAFRYCRKQHKCVTAWVCKEGPKDKGNTGMDTTQPWGQGHFLHPPLPQGERNLYIQTLNNSKTATLILPVWHKTTSF